LQWQAGVLISYFLTDILPPQFAPSRAGTSREGEASLKLRADKWGASQYQG